MSSDRSGVVRRWVGRVALCAGLGVVTTVLIAWGLAAWLPHRGLTERWGRVHIEDGEQLASLVFLDWKAFRRPGMERRSWYCDSFGRWTAPEPLGFELRTTGRIMNEAEDRHHSLGWGELAGEIARFRNSEG